MDRRANYRRVSRALHKLWTRAVGTPGYVKADWRELDNAIYQLATDGPGDVLPEEPKDDEAN